jgi:fructoselysine 6-kinase
MRVIGIGDNVVDDYTMRRTMHPGGNALNFAVYASMLGCDAAYLGVFGTDRAAGHVRKTAKELGIDTSHCITADGPNGRAELGLEGGDRIFLGSNEGGIAKTVPMDFVFDDPGYLASFALMHTSAYSYIDQHLERFAAFDCPVSYDFSDDFDADAALALCSHVDFGFFSCADLGEGEVTGLLQAAIARGVGVVAATRGADDAIVYDGARWFRQPPVAVEPVDTLGAGDAFITAFLVSYVGSDAARAPRIEHALGQAAAFAARICQLEGAFGHGLSY